jgi:RNA polymerase sigma-70 factor (ECF subfamily)
MDSSQAAARTRPSLILRIRDAQDAAAWAVFTDVYGPLVYGYCRRSGLQDCDAADVTQEVMAQVARAVRTFEYRPESGRFRDWLGAVTRHKISNYRRAGRREALGDDGDVGEILGRTAAGDVDPDWADAFNAQVLRAALARARPKFEPATWRAFELAWLENRPAAEASRTLGVPVEAVYLAKSRVLKRLREEVLALAEDMPLYTPLD